MVFVFLWSIWRDNVIYTAIYVVLIVTINYGFSVVPLIPIPGGDMWPPMSLAVGFVFVARDFAQVEIGHKIILAMLLAGVVSYFMATPFIAVASVSAFLASEFSDWAVYSFTKRPFRDRVLLSSVVGTPIDSILFLWIIGHLSVTGVVVMTASKMLGAIIVWVLLRRRARM